eukprot:234655-Amphidinium_carterae.1
MQGVCTLDGTLRKGLSPVNPRIRRQRESSKPFVDGCKEGSDESASLAPRRRGLTWTNEDKE